MPFLGGARIRVQVGEGTAAWNSSTPPSSSSACTRRHMSTPQRMANECDADIETWTMMISPYVQREGGFKVRTEASMQLPTVAPSMPASLSIPSFSALQPATHQSPLVAALIKTVPQEEYIRADATTIHASAVSSMACCSSAVGTAAKASGQQLPV